MTRRRCDSVELDVACCMKVVSPVEGAAQSVASALGLGPDACHFLGLAVREAVINAVRHGCPHPQARVKVSLQVDRRGTLVVTVQDSGRGFDPSRIPDPSRPENLKKGSGRGIFYMQEFCDRVSFRFPRDGGTVVRLGKKLR